MVILDAEVNVVRYALRVAIAKNEMDWAEADYEYNKDKMSEIERRLDALKLMLEDSWD